MSALELIRPDLANLLAYASSDGMTCPLHANELPWAPIAVFDMAVNRYPTTKQQEQLQQQLASRYRISDTQLLVTRGSDEGIDLLMRLFLRAGQDSIMQCPPTFAMYAFYARLQQAALINCPLQESDTGFALSVQAIEEAWQPACKLIMVCRPNNPTADLVDLQTIATLCTMFSGRCMIVVDEAYIEFADSASATSLIGQYDNLIVLRTLSKAYGLAGLRLGAVVAQAAIIQALRRITAPFALSDAVLNPALAALKNEAWFASSLQNIRALRNALSLALRLSPWIEQVYPSAANFVLVKTRHAQSLANWFARHHIAVRYYSDTPQLQTHLRITVGDERQNACLLAALAAFTGV